MTQDLDRSFAALADPTRRAVIERLSAGPASVSTLAAPHAMALPSFMRHIRILEDCGLIRTTKKGRTRICHVETAPLLAVQGWLEWQRRVREKGLEQAEEPQSMPEN